MRLDLSSVLEVILDTTTTTRRLLLFAGDKRDRATPVPIPNTVVKPVSADGTAIVRSWESRPLPAPLRSPLRFAAAGFSCSPFWFDVSFLA